MLHLLLNRAYQRAMISRLNGSMPDAEVPKGHKTEQYFTMAMFALMGRIAKSDGKVELSEVRYASTIMALMGLTGGSRVLAIEYFNQGKLPETDVMNMVSMMVKMIGRRTALADLFLQIQCRASFCKGEMKIGEKVMLSDVSELLGIERADFLDVCLEMHAHVEKAKVEFADEENPQVDLLEVAYETLQLEVDVEDGEIRKAYLRLMSQYHPDKLVRDNLSETHLKLAQDKSAMIRDAYEKICEFREIRA
ncbi:MAG: co-chaperone DjlA [SAR86 cluster bacterium]|uniref:Co-chaperone DjlA n=1 Tax=SAR86 cluster bacterium TaxID=2030880 RepID=A0A2A4MQM0_9GAMM|nr:MAG: co-chaperone DjlA [SAR86 cluster bacterium]